MGTTLLHHRLENDHVILSLKFRSLVKSYGTVPDGR